MVLIAESGSTKTDWCLLKKDKNAAHWKSTGINPYLQSKEMIEKVLEEELKWDHKKNPVEKIFFYGAGAGKTEKSEEVAAVLKKYFKLSKSKVSVQSDLMAAARALSGNKKGIISILGTGSNSCTYDGKKIVQRQNSLGYVAGDEGSGNHLGKKVLQYYAYNTFDEELRLGFEQRFGNDIAAILNNIYKKPFPNRYLASFVPLLIDNRGHYMVENILEDCLNDFFHHHILKYRASWKEPLYFTGSIAYQFRDIIKYICGQYELELGDIRKSPMEGLIKYHKEMM